MTLESGEQFVMYRGELRLFAMKAGSELSDEHYLQIMNNVLLRRAKLRMMALLKQRDYTASQLSKKLLDAGYPESAVTEALEYVKSYGYVDDKRYAEDYIRSQSQQHSMKEIYQKLVQKGIAKSLLDSVFAEYRESEAGSSVSSETERQLALKTLKKRGYTGSESYEERQKLLAYFYRRGFSMDIVYAAMDELKQEQ